MGDLNEKEIQEKNAQRNTLKEQKDKISEDLFKLQYQDWNEILRNPSFSSYIETIGLRIKELDSLSDLAIVNYIESKINKINPILDKYLMLKQSEKEEDEVYINKITAYQSDIEIGILSVLKLLEQYKNINDTFSEAVAIPLKSALTDVLRELEDFRRLRNIADNAKTENIYNDAVDKYRGLESNYRICFYLGIGIVVIISVLLLFFKTLIVLKFLSNIEFWVLKGSILVVGVTLITYFLKQSSHYQHLADQNYQTQVELQAYPTFMESIPTEEAASVRKELALKYFGREIDGAAHKDMSNLIADQMKSTTEMVKASTEAIKNLKG